MSAPLRVKASRAALSWPGQAHEPLAYNAIAVGYGMAVFAVVFITGKCAFPDRLPVAHVDNCLLPFRAGERR